MAAPPPPYPQWGYAPPPHPGWGFQAPPVAAAPPPAEPAQAPPPPAIQLPKSFDSAGPVVAENVRGWDNGKVNILSM